MKASTTKNNRLKTVLYALLSAVFWTALWAFAARIVGKELLLPSPQVTMRRLFELGATDEFWRAVLSSLRNILLGFLYGALIGTLLAVPTALFRPADALLSPLNTVIRATPVASFIILALVWIDSAEVPSFIAFLMVTPIVWNALKTAVRKVDPSLREMAAAYRLSPWRQIRHLYLPSVLPSYVSALLTSLGLAWKAGIAAEVLCRPKGTIGNSLYNAKIYLETPDLFALTLTVILLSLLLEGLFRFLLRQFLGKGENE